jgi:glycosyltransferase involved in cell wall biosynthesis
VLLRDSLGGRLGPVTVLAPTVDPGEAERSQVLEELRDEGIEAVASAPFPGRARAYWSRTRARWLGDLEPLLARASVVHAGLDDVGRPMCFEAFARAVRRGVPAVFVQDTDMVEQVRQRAAGAGLYRRAKAAAYGVAFERCTRWGVRRAGLSLLKGRALMERYGRYARNARSFLDTSHSERDIIAPARLEERLATLGRDRALRLVYCGRLVERKGVDQSIRIVRGAAGLGARVSLDIIGDGPQREELVNLAAGGPVRFLGARPYGPGLLADLAGYDALLFTPNAEDTPRMVFDAYAAGLPVIGSDIAYLRERSREDGACVLMARNDPGGGARALAGLDRERGRLGGLSLAAAEAARVNSAEAWYRRRAEWTLEMLGKSGRPTCGPQRASSDPVRV